MTTVDTFATLTFDQFWTWLVAHPNCIIRAGTEEATLYDDDDLHWHLTKKGPGEVLVQLIRGKVLVAEMVVRSSQVTYVQESIGDKEGECLFEVVAESASGNVAPYFFVLTHRYEEQEALPRGVH